MVTSNQDRPAQYSPTAAPKDPAARYELGKRCLDVTAAALLLLLFLPVLLVIAMLIVAESRGPVLFVQKRVGRYGREFAFFKFRSMVADAEAQRRALERSNERTGPVFKMRNDPRITRVGRVIRATSLDELPQLLNVLRGDMSLVGPRPALPKEVASYTPMERERLAVMPGLTGLWQVSGRAELTFERSVELDLHYVAARSGRLDLEILFRTIPAVLTRRGAY